MPRIDIDIESQTDDRKITLAHFPHTGSRVITVTRVANGREEFAFLTPKGARDLIDALEPFAEPPGGWTEPMGGSMQVYNQIRDIQPYEGQRIRIIRPGKPVIETTVMLSDNMGYARVNLDGGVFYLGDMSNGYPGHNWMVQFEIPQEPEPDYLGQSIEGAKRDLEHNPWSRYPSDPVDKNRDTTEQHRFWRDHYVGLGGNAEDFDREVPLEDYLPERQPSLYDHYLELEPGTRFKTADGYATFTKISDEVMVRERGGDAKIYGFDWGSGFGHWKDPRQTVSHRLEVL